MLDLTKPQFPERRRVRCRVRVDRVPQLLCRDVPFETQQLPQVPAPHRPTQLVAATRSFRPCRAKLKELDAEYCQSARELQCPELFEEQHQSDLRPLETRFESLKQQLPQLEQQ